MLFQAELIIYILYIIHPDNSVASGSYNCDITVNFPNFTNYTLYYYLVGGGGMGNDTSSSLGGGGGSGGSYVNGNILLSSNDVINITVGSNNTNTNIVINDSTNTASCGSTGVVNQSNKNSFKGSSFTDYGFSRNKNVYFYGGGGGIGGTSNNNSGIISVGSGGNAAGAVGLTGITGTNQNGGAGGGYNGGAGGAVNQSGGAGGPGGGGGGAGTGGTSINKATGGSGGAGGGGGGGGAGQVGGYINNGGLGGVGGGGGGGGGGARNGGAFGNYGGKGGVGVIVLYLAQTSESQVPCFKEQSLILTINGYIPIQNLRKGDLIKTLSNGYVPLKIIGKKNIDNKFSGSSINRLFVCTNKNYPEVFEDLYITGLHSILVDNLTEEQHENVRKLYYSNNDILKTEGKFRLPVSLDEKAYEYGIEEEVTIYHLARDNENEYDNYVIYANGLLVETTSIKLLKDSDMTLLE